MGYDVYVYRKSADGKEVVAYKEPKVDIAGGTYCVGGARESHLHITYNYGPFFREYIGDYGIRSLYGLKPNKAIEKLNEALLRMPSEPPDNDYWASTVGNARNALVKLRQMIEYAILEGDPEEMYIDGD